MRLGYFGGSFDPPHLGHLAVARAAAARFSLDEVLFVPTGRQPLKPQGAVASFADRLAMTGLLCGDSSAGETQTLAAPRLSASALEAPAPDGRPSYTVDTLERLRAQRPAGDLVFAMAGADAFLDLRRWREPDRLLSLAEWIVISRPGFSLEQLEALRLTPAQRQRVHLLEGVNEAASATEVRKRLGRGDDCRDLLSPGVLAYIRERGLYGSPSREGGSAENALG